MKYRNQKRYAAIWVLNELIKPNKAVYIGEATLSTEVKDPAYIRSKHLYKTLELFKKSNYHIEVFADAIYFIKERKYIEAVITSTDIKQWQININDAGVDALRDEILEDEIKTYNSDRYYQNFRWILPLVAIAISLASIIMSFSRNKSEQPSNILKISNHPQLSDSLSNKAKQLKIKNLTRKGDNNHDSSVR